MYVLLCYWHQVSDGRNIWTVVIIKWCCSILPKYHILWRVQVKASDYFAKLRKVCSSMKIPWVHWMGDFAHTNLAEYGWILWYEQGLGVYMGILTSLLQVLVRYSTVANITIFTFNDSMLSVQVRMWDSQLSVWK